jgi:hypothetical protein
MLDVPPFTLDQGADLLAATGGAWLAEESRRELVQAVDGHALAVGVLARLLAGEPPRSDLQKLCAPTPAFSVSYGSTRSSCLNQTAI